MSGARGSGRTKWRSVLFGAVLLSAGSVHCASHTAQSSPSVLAPKDPFGSLTFMLGCWRGPGLEERYERTEWGILGASKFLEGETVVQQESTRIEMGPSGLMMTPTVDGKVTLSFASATGSETRQVFENRANDFPQRVIYFSPGPNLLTARIEGSLSDAAKSMQWEMQRVDCVQIAH
jgi:hypothetical protein